LGYCLGMDNATPLTVLEYGHKVKIAMCVKMVEMGSTKSVRAFWQRTLDVWDERARVAGFVDAAAWVKAS
jgi:hypothetical protein